VPEQSILPGEQGIQFSPRDWSAAAKAMVYARINETGVWNLWSIGTDSGAKAVPYRSGPFNEPEASFSPNGQYLAFTSNESGRNEVMVQPFPDASRGRWQISTDGGVAPRWRRDGRELYYLDPKGRLMAVSVTTDRGFAVQQTSPLIQTPIPLPITAASSSFSYDVTPDGQRFLIAVPQAGAAPAPLAVRLYGLTALTH
jgi:Tol biopolymer transport system component